MGNLITFIRETQNLHPVGTHNAMKHIIFSEGFCLIDPSQGGGDNDSNNPLGKISIGAGGSKDVTPVLGVTLPSLRANEHCINAKLELWLQEPYDNDLVLSIHRLLVDYIHTEANWINRKTGTAWSIPGLASGVDYEATAITSGSIGTLRGSPVITFDLTTWVRDACDGVTANNGFIIIPSGDPLSQQFFYGTGANGFIRPVFTIETAFFEQHNATYDASIDEATPTVNYGSNLTLFYGDPFGAGNTRHVLITCDLSTVNPAAEISQVLLWIKTNTAMSGIDNELYPLLVDWVESEVTWNERKTGVNWSTAGGEAGVDYDDTQVVASSITTGINTYFSIDITDIAKQWISGTLDNNGILCKYVGVSATTKNWYSLDGTGGSNTPYIEVIYQL